MNPQTDTPESAEATRHELKTWPPYFARVQDGSKTFEIRENDRDFKIGDTLWLREWDATFGYSGKSVDVVVTYLTSWNQPPGQVVLGIKLNYDLNARLQRCEEALRGMEALATGEGWNTPIFSAPFGAALREARSALTHPTRNEGEKKV